MRFKKFIMLILMLMFIVPFSTFAQTDIRPSGIKIINHQGGSTYSRKVATAIGIYTKNGTVPGITKHSGTWGGKQYNYLEIDSAGKDGTFIQVDYAGSSGTNDNPKTFNNFYDKTITLNDNYYWAGAINAGFFVASSSDPMYGYPVGGVKKENKWQTYNSAGTNNTDWETKSEHGTGFVTAYFNKNQEFELIYNGWNHTDKIFYSDWQTPTWDWETKHSAYTEGVSGAYTLMVNRDSSIHWGKNDYKGTNYWNYVGTGTTLLGQKANGNYILLTTVGGISATQQVALMKDLGCTDAIRFDGGGSTQMAFDNGLIVDHFFIDKKVKNIIEGQPLDISDITMDVYMKDGSYHSATIQDAPQAEVKIYDSGMHEVMDITKSLPGEYYLKVFMNGLEQQIPITVEAKEFTVNFENGMGEIIHTEIVQNGATAVGPNQPPRREGYTFSGWNFDLNNIKSNLTIKAVWTPIEYTINLDLDGGAITGNPTSYTIESPTITINNPTKNGYEFIGWSTLSEPNKLIKELTINTGSIGDLSYKANYKIINYQIDYQFDMLNVINNNPNTYTVEDEILLTNPMVDGYNFIGWYVDGNPTPEGIIHKGTTGNLQLYGEFELINYTVTFNDPNVKPIIFDINKLPINLPNLTKEGFNFDGWYDNKELLGNSLTQITTLGNYSLYPKWTIKTYTVEYIDSLGQSLGSEVVEHGKPAIKDISKVGYTFILDKVIDNIISNVQVKVTYTPIEYNINYHNVTAHNNPTKYTIEDSINLGNPTKEGYNFLGWYLEPEFKTAVTSIGVGTTGNKDLYAKWEAKDVNYTVSHETQQGVVLQTEQLRGKYDQKVTIQPLLFDGYTSPQVKTEILKNDVVIKMIYTPIEYIINIQDGVANKNTAIIGETITIKFNRPNSRFISWNSDVSLKDNLLSETTFVMPSKNVNISANYQDVIFINKINLTVPVPVKGNMPSNVTIDNQNVEYVYEWQLNEQPFNGPFESNTAYSIKVTINPKKDYKFATSVITNVNGVQVNNQVIDNSLIIKYTFPATEKNSYTVQFVDYDGRVIKTDTVLEHDSATAPIDPIREGYIFMGWDKEFNNIISNLTVRATYNAKVYDVTFEDWNGSIITTQKVEHGQAASAPNAERRGYNHTGWDVSFDNVTDNLLVKAQYQVITYNITYDYQTDNPITYTVEDIINLKGVSKIDYLFDGWYTEPEFLNKVTTIENSVGDINLYAKFIRENCNITLDYGYDNKIEVIKSPCNHPIQSLPTPHRDGYIFRGWYLNDQIFDKEEIIIDDITLKATWEKNIVTHYTGSISKTEFWTDEAITKDLITITAHYLDGTTKIIPQSDYEINFMTDITTPGKHQLNILNINTKEVMTTLTITTKRKEPIVTGITLQQIKDIKVNDNVDKSYFTLKAEMSDGTTKIIPENDYEIPTIDTHLPAVIKVAVTYKDKTTSIDVKVIGTKIIIFEVINGKWNDDTDEQKIETVEFDGTMITKVVVHPEVGGKPNLGYKAGEFTPVFNGEVTYDGPNKFIYQYVPDLNINKTLKYTVNYFAEDSNGEFVKHTSQEFKKEIWVNDPNSILDVDKAQINLTDKIKGMIYDESESDTIPTTIENGGNINIYYSRDNNKDMIPDRYQKFLEFRVINGAWNDGNNGVINITANLKTNGKLNVDGIAEINIPEVGTQPNVGYAVGSWNVVPSNSINKYSEVKYEYRYNKDVTITQPTEFTVRHIVGSDVLYSKKYESTAWINEENPMIQIENGALSVMEHLGYTFVKIDVPYKEGDMIPSKTIINLIYEIDLTKTKNIKYYIEYHEGSNVLHREEIIKKVWINAPDEVEPNTVDTDAYLTNGYKVKDDFVIPNKVKTNDVIIVEYIPDLTVVKPIKYQVNYYLDNLHSTEHSYEVIKSIWVNEPNTDLILENAIDINPEKFPEYIFDRSEPTVLPQIGDEIPNNMIYNIYYRSKPTENKINVIFKVDKGSWNDGSLNDKVVEFVLDKNGEVISDVPKVGGQPESFHKVGQWYPAIPEKFTQEDNNKVYTYTYEPMMLDYSIEFYLDDKLTPELTQNKQALFGEVAKFIPERIIEFNGKTYEVLKGEYTMVIDNLNKVLQIKYKPINGDSSSVDTIHTGGNGWGDAWVSIISLIGLLIIIKQKRIKV